MPIKPNVENAKIPLMRKNEIFIDGYPMPLVSTLTDDLVADQQQFDVYGLEQQIYYRILDGGTLRMESINDATMQILFDLTTGQDPFPGGASPAVRSYFPNENVQVDVLRNMLNEASDGYDTIDFWPRWNTIIKMPAGGPRDRGTVGLDGRCRAPIKIWAKVGQKIVGVTDVLTLDKSPTGTAATVNGSTTALYTPVYDNAVDAYRKLATIPTILPFRNTPTYALSLEVQCRVNSVVMNSLRLAVTDVNVYNADALGSLGTGSATGEVGAVKVTDFELAPFGWTCSTDGAATNTQATHAFLTYVVDFADLAGSPANGRLYDGVAGSARYESARF